MASYRDLEVYQTGYRLALEVHHLTMTFPQEERFGLVDQMRRCSRSIPANLAEGWGVSTGRNFAHYVGQALGSANEMAVHLDFARDLGYLDQERHLEVQRAYEVLAKRLYVLREKRLQQDSSQ